MPCYQDRTIYTNLDLVDQETLKEVLTELGLSWTTRQGQVAVADLNEQTTKQIKRTYAEKVVRKVAKKKGWNLTKTGNKIQVRR